MRHIDLAEPNEGRSASPHERGLSERAASKTLEVPPRGSRIPRHNARDDGDNFGRDDEQRQDRNKAVCGSAADEADDRECEFRDSQQRRNDRQDEAGSVLHLWPELGEYNNQARMNECDEGGCRQQPVWRCRLRGSGRNEGSRVEFDLSAVRHGQMVWSERCEVHVPVRGGILGTNGTSPQSLLSLRQQTSFKFRPERRGRRSE